MSLMNGNPFNKGGNGGSGGDIPDASLVQKGITQLSNAIDSDSQTLSATSKAVKDSISHTESLISQINYVHKGVTPPLDTNLIWKKE